MSWLLVLLAACSNERSRAAGPDFHKDSAGITYVRTSVPLPETSLWPTEVVYSTLGLDVTPFWVFTDARFASDTTLVVTHDAELLLLSREGRLIRTIGREGMGPGEYRIAARLAIGIDGTLLVADNYTQRVTVLNPHTWVPRIIPYLGTAGSTYDRDILTLLPDGHIVATYSQDRPNRDGAGIPRDRLERDSAPLLLFDSSGTLAATLGTWLGLERTPPADIGEQLVRLPPAFARTALAQGRGLFTAITPSDSLDLSLYRDTQLILRWTAPATNQHASDRQRAGWESAVRADHDDLADKYFAVVSNAPRPPYLPSLGGLGVDDHGNVWLGAYVPPGDSTARWTIASPRGDVLGSVVLPALPAKSLPGRRELLDVYGDHLVLLRQTPAGEPYVEVRRFRRPLARQ